MKKSLHAKESDVLLLKNSFLDSSATASHDVRLIRGPHLRLFQGVVAFWHSR